MIVHDRFVFLEVRKTGCTFIANALQEVLPAGSYRVLSKHLSWREIPSEVGDLPVLAYVRNPWDWYVSWYHFSKPRQARDKLFWQLSDRDRLGFVATISNACELFASHMGCDLYTFSFRMGVGRGLGSQRLTIARFESLVDDLEAFLDTVGVRLAAADRNGLRAMGRMNASERGPYRSYYDDELRELVRRSSAPLIERFGYRF